MKKVLKAQLSANQKHVSSGCTIEFNMNENIQLESIVKVRANERTFNFNVNGISADGGEYLKISATEVGYWGSKIDRLKDFDIRNLIGVEIELVTDTEVIKQIRQSSSYC